MGSDLDLDRMGTGLKNQKRNNGVRTMGSDLDLDRMGTGLKNQGAVSPVSNTQIGDVFIESAFSPPVGKWCRIVRFPEDPGWTVFDNVKNDHLVPEAGGSGHLAGRSGGDNEIGDADHNQGRTLCDTKRSKER